MPVSPIVYDYSKLIVPDDAPAFVRQTALVNADLKYVAPRLTLCRQEVVENAGLWATRGPVPPEKQPLDAAFFDLPNQLLDEERDLLDQIMATGDRLARLCNRVIVLGIGGSYMGARAVFEACCHPYHNELDRTARGGRPQIYFAGNNLDNDSTQGLLDVLGEADDWGIVVISKSGGTLETAVAFRLFLDALQKGCKGDMKKVRERVVPVTGKTGRLRDLAEALELPETYPIPDGVGGRFSVLSAVGLLPAAIMGADVERLLEGAVAMNDAFRQSAPLENPALDYAGISWLMQTRRNANIRVLSTWGDRLEAVGLWYDQLLAESLGKHGQGPTPLTVVNTRDLHSRGQQHQEGSRDRLITNLVVETCQREPITVERSDYDQDRLNELAGRSLPEFLTAAQAGTDRAYLDDYRPMAAIRLPRRDEASLGQLFQMLMIATVVEGRLIGINPYGQPGVEAYKHNMNSLLRK